jgi:hypothetical protein
VGLHWMQAVQYVEWPVCPCEPHCEPTSHQFILMFQPKFNSKWPPTDRVLLQSTHYLARSIDWQTTTTRELLASLSKLFGREHLGSVTAALAPKLQLVRGELRRLAAVRLGHTYLPRTLTHAAGCVRMSHIRYYTLKSFADTL